MAKINYNKVEKELNEALRAIYVQKLMRGEPSVSKRAVSFYGMDQGPNPKPQDSVMAELEAIEKEEAEFELLEAERIQRTQMAIQKDKEAVLEGLQAHMESGHLIEEGTEELALEEITPQKKIADQVTTEHKIDASTSSPLPSKPEIQTFPIIDETTSPLPPLFLLRRLILWMRKKRVVDVYKLLGTTEEEIIAIRKKEKLTPQDEMRILEILKKGKLIKEKLLKKLGLENDKKIVAQEYKTQKNKRFNTKDTWLPL